MLLKLNFDLIIIFNWISNLKPETLSTTVIQILRLEDILYNIKRKKSIHTTSRHWLAWPTCSHPVETLTQSSEISSPSLLNCQWQVVAMPVPYFQIPMAFWGVLLANPHFAAKSFSLEPSWVIVWRKTAHKLSSELIDNSIVGCSNLHPNFVSYTKYNSFSGRSIRILKQNRDLEAGADLEAMEGCCLLAYFNMVLSAFFLIEWRISSPGTASPIMRWALSHQSLI